MTQTIKVTIQGTTPILFNRFRDVAIEGKSKKRTGAMAESDIEDKLYLDEDGKPQLPSVYIKNSIVEAAKQFKIVGKGKSTYSKLIASTVEIYPFYIEFKADKYKVFRISAVNPMTKGRQEYIDLTNELLLLYTYPSEQKRDFNKEEFYEQCQWNYTNGQEEIIEIVQKLLKINN